MVFELFFYYVLLRDSASKEFVLVLYLIVSEEKCPSIHVFFHQVEAIMLIPKFSWGHIQSCDMFRPIACELKYLMNDKAR